MILMPFQYLSHPKDVIHNIVLITQGNLFWIIPYFLRYNRTKPAVGVVCHFVTRWHHPHCFPSLP